jgi:hypothetical protein
MDTNTNTNDYTELHDLIQAANKNRIVLPQDVYDLAVLAERLRSGVHTMTVASGRRHKTHFGVSAALEAVHRLAQFVAEKEAKP